MKGSMPLIEKIDESIHKKVSLIDSSFARYAVRAMLATLFLGLGTAVAFAVAMKGEDMAHGLGKMLYAIMFSWSLVMIIYLNAELTTSNMLYMTVGVYRKKVAVAKAMKILFACLLFNLIGGVLIGYLLSLTGPFQQLPADNYMFETIAGKLAKPALQIFIEGIFANVLVNIAVVGSMRMKDDSAKIAFIIFIISIFAFLGYEHVIANFPAFSLAYFASHGTISMMTMGNVMKDLVFAFLGNFVGGGLVIGLSYAWLNRTDSSYID